MNPFSGFMQSVTGLMPGFGDQPGHIGQGPHRLPVGDDILLSADENTRTFLAWVQNFRDNAAGAGVDGEIVFNFQPSDLDPDLPALDQMQALMADATDQFAQDQPAAQSLKDGSFDNGHVPLPQRIIDAIITHHQRMRVADTPPRDGLPDIPEMRVAKEITPAVGQTQIALKDPLFQTAVSGVPTQAGNADEHQVKAGAPTVGQTTNAAGEGPQPQAAAQGIPTPVANADDSRLKARSPEPVMKENRPEEGVEKADARVLFKPAAPAGDEGHAPTNRLMQERLPAGAGIIGKANDPAAPHLPPVAGQAKDPESFMVTGLTGQGSAHAEDDAADFRGKDPHQSAQRVELAHDNEEARRKGQSSDTVKGTVAEQPKPQLSFQDTAKAMAGDQATNMTGKPAAGQATVLTRTEDAAVKSFQTSVMDQIVDKAAMRSIHGRSEIQIRLKPEFLGNVQMNIAADKEQLVVRIITDRPVVKEIIETHLHHLKTELQNQGLTIDKFEVTVNPDGNQQHSREQFAGMFKHHFSQNGRQQAQGQDPETPNRDGGNNPDDVQPNRDGINYFA
ncbi:MAG: flagellar hook-length control protein FliK [Desulfosarcina sp.]|nr:flagellar hook-length control protein FliK [Desulfosarcina sp.]